MTEARTMIAAVTIGHGGPEMIEIRRDHPVPRPGPGQARLWCACVVDVVGGDEFGLLIDRLRDGGRMVTAGAIAGPVVPFDIRQLYLHQRTVIGSTMHTPGDFADLAAIAIAGGIRPIVAAAFPLTEIAAAHLRFVAHDFVGKLVLQP